MSSVNLQVSESVLAFSLVVLLAVVLRRFSIISEEDGGLFARLRVKVVLPVVIFSKLAALPIAGHQFLLVLVMIVSGLVCFLEHTQVFESFEVDK